MAGGERKMDARTKDGGTRNDDAEIARLLDGSDRIARGITASAREADRQARLLERDAEYREQELRREAAQHAIDQGQWWIAEIDDARLGPTPEQLAKGNYAEVQIEAPGQTARAFTAMQNVTVSRIVQLNRRGVIDDDCFAACNWYQKRFMEGGLAVAAATAAFDERLGGDGPLYGHMPRSEKAAHARHDFRYARSFIPSDIVNLFDGVVLSEWSIADAARATRCRYANAVGAFRHGAYLLHGGIAHLLPIRNPGEKDA